jgi:hypothetical protein
MFCGCTHFRCVHKACLASQPPPPGQAKVSHLQDVPATLAISKLLGHLPVHAFDGSHPPPSEVLQDDLRLSGCVAWNAPRARQVCRVLYGTLPGAVVGSCLMDAVVATNMGTTGPGGCQLTRHVTEWSSAAAPHSSQSLSVAYKVPLALCNSIQQLPQPTSCHSCLRRPCLGWL